VTKETRLSGRNRHTADRINWSRLTASEVYLAGIVLLIVSLGSAVSDEVGKAHDLAAVKGLVKSGTGFFVSSDGFLLASAHVVAGCHAISLWPASGQEQPAHIIASDAKNDIALLSTDDLRNATSTRAASNPLPGEPVSTIGFGVLRTQPREAVVTDGTLIGEAMSDAGNQILLIEASLLEGNSGGPVIDVRGSLVGVVTGRDAARPDLGIAAPSSQIDQFLSRQGIGPMSNFPGEGRPVDRATLLKAMSVLVQCAPEHAGSAGHRL